MTPTEREIERLCADFISGDYKRWAPAGDRLMQIGEPAFVPLTEAYRAASAEVLEEQYRLFWSILKRIDFERAVAFFTQVIHEPNLKVQLATIKVLKIMPVGGFQALQQARLGPNEIVRQAAIEVTKSQWDRYVEAMQQPDLIQRWEALGTLAQVDDPRGIEQLLGILRQDGAVLAQYVGASGRSFDFMKREAAFVLGKKQVVEAVPALIGYLHETKFHPVSSWNHESSMATQASDALVRIGQPALPALQEAAEQHPNAVIRAEAQRLVGFIAAKHPPAMPYVPDQELWAMYAEAMQAHTDFEQRWYLLVRLVHRRDPRGIETLIGILRRNTDTLPHFLQDKTFTETFKRHEAAFLFGKLQIEAAIPALITGLAENQSAPAGSWQHQGSMAEEAFDALVRIGQPALPALRWAAETYNDPNVRRQAADLLAHIAANKPVPRRWVLDEP